jgi:hypothetical protein
MASTVGTRLAYEKAKQALANAGFNPNQVVLSQSYLRLEVALSTSITNYQFPVLVNDVSSSNTTSFATEQRLNLQDSFVISSLGFFVAAPSSSTAVDFQLATYPNPYIFSTTNAASSLFNWYNSSLTLTVNNRQIVPAYDLYRHYSVPQQQGGNAYTTAQTQAFRDQQDGGESAFYPIEPAWVLVGSKQNTLQVQLPSAMAAIQANSRAILILRGHLAQNSTPVR